MNLKQSVVVVAVGALAFAAGRAGTWGDAAVAAQPEKKPAATAPKGEAQPDKKMQEMMEQMMAKMQPGAEHKALEPLIGDWEGDVKFWMDAGAEPMKSHGTIHREWTLGKRWVMERVDAPPMDPGGAPFQGLGYVGYNTVEKRYENVWLENMATWMMTSTGTYDATKKTLTFTGEDLDPRTSTRRKTRATIDLSNPNRQTMEGYCTPAGGKEFKNFEGVFEKKK